MNFKLGKKYIVKVSEGGIVPIEEFDESRWYDKDHDDLDLLTDEEKIVVINQVLDKIRAEIDSHCSDNRDRNDGLYIAMRIIDKYQASQTGAEGSEE